MIRTFLLLFLFGILLLSCAEKPLKVVSASFFEENISRCKTVSCPEITVNYITVAGDKDSASLINTEIQDFIISSLYIGDEEQPSTASSILHAATGFVETYRLENAEFPDMAAEYFIEVTVTESFNTADLLSLELRNYLYTGGAHGYGAVIFKNYDPQTGLEWRFQDLIKDEVAFYALAEHTFRKAHDIRSNEPINSTGFWFENEVFALPETIGFTEINLILHYNQYEIASYAAGPIEVEIPLKEIQALLEIELVEQ
ncbi:MAG: hypothetical protein ACI86C_000080 [Candidatus Latescibacterota bacterium]|jgi:hypothetical protein